MPKTDRRKRILTSEEEKQMVDKYVIGLLSTDKICKEYKICHARFNSILLKYGYKKRKSNDLNHFILTKEMETELLSVLKEESNHKIIQSKLSFQMGKEKIKEYISKNLVKRTGLNLYEYWAARFGVEKADELNKKLKQRQSNNFSGSGNPMYGKPSPQGSGNGYKGWYKGFYFRSLRELSYLLDLDDSNIAWSSGEAHKFDVPYINYDGTQRTYRPDFFVNNEKLVEIKPKRLQKTPNIMAKTAAAIEKCKEWGLKYEITDYKIQAEKIKKALDAGLVKFTRDYEKRFLEYLDTTALKSS